MCSEYLKQTSKATGLNRSVCTYRCRYIQVGCLLISRREGQGINAYEEIDFEKLALRLSLLIDLFVYSSFNYILISITQQDDSWLMNGTGCLRTHCPVLTGMLWRALLDGLKKGTKLGEDDRSPLDKWTFDSHLTVIFCGKLINL